MSRKKERQPVFVYEYIEKGMKLNNRKKRKINPILNEPTRGWKK